MLLSCPYQPIAETSSQWKELIPLVSPVVVILLFIIDRLIGYNLRKKETDRSWYFKVLIEPGIEKISIFYRNTNNSYSTAAKNLEANKTIPHIDFGILKAKEFFKFQESKRELEAEIIQPIIARYQFIGNSLTLVLQDLEDLYTSSLDNEYFSEEEINKFYLSAFTNRALLLNQLYSPLQPNPHFLKRGWLWLRAKSAKK
jgi:hypothetical protein